MAQDSDEYGKKMYFSEIVRLIKSLADAFDVRNVNLETLPSIWTRIFQMHEYITIEEIIQAGDYLMATETESYGRLPLPGKILDSIHEKKAKEYFKGVASANKMAQTDKRLHSPDEASIAKRAEIIAQVMKPALLEGQPNG